MAILKRQAQKGFETGGCGAKHSPYEFPPEAAEGHKRTLYTFRVTFFPGINIEPPFCSFQKNPREPFALQMPADVTVTSDLPHGIRMYRPSWPEVPQAPPSWDPIRDATCQVARDREIRKNNFPRVALLRYADRTNVCGAKQSPSISPPEAAEGHTGPFKYQRTSL